MTSATGRTAEYPEPPRERSRAPVEVLPWGLADPDAQLRRLVRSRLRQFFVIMLVIYLAFLARDSLRPNWEAVRVQWSILCVAMVGQLGVVVVSRLPFSERRGVIVLCEWFALFIFVGQQGANHYLALNTPAEPQIFLDAGSPDVGILTANTWLLPWLVIVVGYPVIVPHAWRQTLAIVALLVCVPPAVTLASTMLQGTPSWPESRAMYPQYVIWGAVAVGIAVYGASQGQALRREAFEARQFGQYRLREKIGEGGMGEVYLAEHMLLRRPSVVKLIRKEHNRDAKVLQRFEREVKLLATLTHWNSVEVYDYGHTPDGTFYFVMEHLPGLNLHELVAAHGPLPPARAVHLVTQVCAALREAHAAGLIHRDVKPSNVMVCERGGVADTAKLLDFGLVQATLVEAGEDPRLTREGTIVGTPQYMSPEQARGLAVDGRSDVYSLGATLYFAVTGRAPFVGTVMDVLAAHILEAPKPPRDFAPELPDDLGAVILVALAKDPAARYPDVRSFATALRDCGCAAEWCADHAATWWAERR